MDIQYIIHQYKQQLTGMGVSVSESDAGTNLGYRDGNHYQEVQAKIAKEEFSGLRTFLSNSRVHTQIVATL